MSPQLAPTYLGVGSNKVSLRHDALAPQLAPTYLGVGSNKVSVWHDALPPQLAPMMHCLHKWFQPILELGSIRILCDM